MINRPQSRVDLAVLAIFAGLYGCGDAGLPGETGPTYHSDVAPILEGRCIQCHQSGGIAPFSLTTYDEVYEVRAALTDAVQTRAMPPWHAANEHRAYRGDPSLTEAQIQTIVDWFANGAVAGDPEAPSADPPPRVSLGTVSRDVSLTMPEAYTPLAERPDDYRCLPLEWTGTETHFVTGFAAEPERAGLVHHMTAFLFGPELAPIVRELDAVDSKPGYTCFGSPAVDEEIPLQALGTWQPGATSARFPEGTGIRIEPGSVIVLQMHYNVGDRAPESDRSTFHLSLADSVEREANYVAYLDVLWVLGGMDIPAGEPRVSHTVRGDPRDIFGFFTPELSFEEGFEIHSVLPHQHLLGITNRLDLVRPDDSRETILEIPFWDFDWQRQYWLVEPVRFRPGDQLALECVWDNSPSNQPVVNGERLGPRDVNWGDGSEDEMCVSFIFITEPAEGS